MICFAQLYVQSATSSQEVVAWFETFLSHVSSGDSISPGVFFITLTLSAPKIIDSIYKGTNDRKKIMFDKDYQMSNLDMNHQYRMKELELNKARNNNTVGADEPIGLQGTKPLLKEEFEESYYCLLYTSPSPRDATLSRMPSSA